MLFVHLQGAGYLGLDYEDLSVWVLTTSLLGFEELTASWKSDAIHFINVNHEEGKV